MPAKDFALPKKRKFPLTNPANPKSPTHALQALRMASRAQKAGNITAAEKATVIRKATAMNKKLSAKKGAKK